LNFCANNEHQFIHLAAAVSISNSRKLWSLQTVLEATHIHNDNSII